MLLRSCAFFYKFCIDNPETFALLETFTGTTLPWNAGSMQERENWLYSGYGENENAVLSERLKLLWFQHLDHWFEVFFQNPHFYLRWSEEDGWGWYLRHDVNDIRAILNSKIMQHSTFVESIEESDMEILKAFGFRSFFRYTNNPGSQSSDWWICYGLLWLANSCENSPIVFDHLYDCFQVNDPDSGKGLPYRSMVQWYRRVWNEEIDEDIALVHDQIEFDIGPVTYEDWERIRTTGDIDFFQAEVLQDDNGTDIGMEETFREVYFSMRARYYGRELDQISYLTNSQFYMNYEF